MDLFWALLAYLTRLLGLISAEYRQIGRIWAHSCLRLCPFWQLIIQHRFRDQCGILAAANRQSRPPAHPPPRHPPAHTPKHFWPWVPSLTLKAAYSGVYGAYCSSLVWSASAPAAAPRAWYICVYMCHAMPSPVRHYTRHHDARSAPRRLEPGGIAPTRREPGVSRAQTALTDTPAIYTTAPPPVSHGARRSSTWQPAYRSAVI